MKTLLQIIFLVLAYGQAAAQADFSSLYDEKTLSEWQAIYQEDVPALYRDDILPYLTPEQRASLSDVKFEFPRIGPQKGVFEYYASGRTITMPVVSLRFLRDLCLAYGWLQANGHDVSTVQQYVGMIHTRPASDFKDGRYPLPLDALGIPANAKENALAQDVLSKCMTTNTFFILAHELAHIHFQHPGNNNVDARLSRINESDADGFALDMMKRKKLIPFGLVLFFGCTSCSEAHRADFPDQQAFELAYRKRTHPLSAERLDNIATLLKDSAPAFAEGQLVPSAAISRLTSMSSEISKISEALKSENAHRLMRQMHLTTDPLKLAPRPAGSIAKEPFSGNYQCTITAATGSKTFRIQFLRSGANVIAELKDEGGITRIMGTVQGSKLTAQWWEEKNSGTLLLRSNPEDTGFSGTFGLSANPNISGTWEGIRLP
jgi:hypothetical protein